MPKGKGKGGRGGGTKAERARRRALARELPTGADDVPRFGDGARIWSRLERRRCANCARQLDLDAPRLRVCGRCGFAQYCDVECQRADWEDHRTCPGHRRRYCDVCPRRAAETEPRFYTCHCGKRCYCGEECQAKDWAAGHAQKCASGYLYLDGS